MSNSINQKAYLQKYLSGPSNDKKKKKKKVVKAKGFKIIDDDIDLTKLRPLDGDELDVFDEGEDGPQIAGIIDERPEELRKLDTFTSAKWKVINQDDGFNSKVQIQEIRKNIKEKEKENELVFGKMYSDSEDDKNNDSDLSPPRQKNDNGKTMSVNKPQNNSDNDFSPPRKKDNESRKRNDKNYDSDVSPPRRNESRPKERRKPSRWGYFEDVVSETSNKNRNERNNSRNSDSDVSPPRKSKHSDSESPSRKHKKKYKDDNSDMSPPRKSKKDYAKRSEIISQVKAKSPYRESNKHKDRTEKYSKSKRNRSPDSDLSPKRKNRRSQSPKAKGKRRYGSDSDLSPPRKDKGKRKDDSDISPPRKDKTKKRHDSDSDMSPPRKGKDRRQDNSDFSPQRKDKNKRIRNNDSPPPTNKKMARTLEGKLAGLQDAVQLREENEAFRKREEDAFKKMADEVSGRNAQAVSRKGKRETSEDRQKQREKAERQKELDEKYKKWSKGLKQIEAHEERVQEFMHEAAKPLARHRDDRDLEHRLKQVERDGDPMLQYIKEKKRERGELPPAKPSYKGSFPPNRFNIRPGYRWDGVDRSNGYEKKYFDQQSKRKAQEEEAYKWSTEDL